MTAERSRRFGAYFAELRRERLGMSLRQFCEVNGFDPGNISKLERGRLPPPHSQAVLKRYAGALNLTPGSDEWYEFLDRAAAARGEIPADVMRKAEVVRQLPILFRTLRGRRVPDEELRDLIEMIRSS